MDKTLMEQKVISIFRTSISNEEDILKTADLLNRIVGPAQWNFDLEDIDQILRINANASVNSFLAQELHKLGFECTELW